MKSNFSLIQESYQQILPLLMSAKCIHCNRHLVTCAHCDGRGKHSDGRRCGICGGSGKLCPKHGSDHGN